MGIKKRDDTVINPVYNRLVQRTVKTYANDTGRLFLVYIILLIIGTFVSLFVAEPYNNFIVYIFDAVLFLAYSAVYCRIMKPGFKIPKFKDLFQSLIIIVPLYIFLTAVGSFVQAFLPNMTANTDALMTFVDKPLMYLLLVYAFLPAVTEEFLFRGIMLDAFSYESFGIGVILTSLAFSFAHADISTMFQTLLFGIVLAFVRFFTGSLFCTIVMHFCYNAFTVLLIRYNEFFVSKWFTDLGVFSFVIVAVLSLFCVLCLLAAMSKNHKLDLGYKFDQFKSAVSVPYIVALVICCIFMILGFIGS